jgi:hypothetical protein
MNRRRRELLMFASALLARPVLARDRFLEQTHGPDRH